MARRTAQSFDEASFVQEGTISATGGMVSALVASPTFNLTIQGTFVGELVVERTFDGTTTFVPLSIDLSGLPVRIYSPISVPYYEPEAGVTYRVRAVSITSGTVTVRISGGW